jgi:hypothetical protein
MTDVPEGIKESQKSWEAELRPMAASDEITGSAKIIFLNNFFFSKMNKLDKCCLTWNRATMHSVSSSIKGHVDISRVNKPLSSHNCLHCSLTLTCKYAQKFMFKLINLFLHFYLSSSKDDLVLS